MLTNDMKRKTLK